MSVDEVSIRLVKNAILHRCQSEDEVYELLSYLASIQNWQELIAEREYEDAVPWNHCERG